MNAVEVPTEMLSASALDGVIAEFIQREGTDYGWHEVSYEKKTEQVRRQLLEGAVKIIFDPSTESVTMLTEHQWQKLRLEANV